MNRQNKKSDNFMEYIENKMDVKKTARDRKKKHNMKVGGASVRQLQKIIKDKSK